MKQGYQGEPIPRDLHDPYGLHIYSRPRTQDSDQCPIRLELECPMQLDGRCPLGAKERRGTAFDGDTVHRGGCMPLLRSNYPERAGPC